MPHTPQEQSGFIKAMDQSAIDSMNVSKIVEVVGVNGGFVDVKPIINRGPMVEDGTRDYKPATTIFGLPVITYKCGNIKIKPVIENGCQGVIVHSDDDIDNYLTGGGADPHTARRHDYNDAYFFPGITSEADDLSNNGCWEVVSENVTLRICNDSFDVIQNGDSLINTLKATRALPANWGT